MVRRANRPRPEQRPAVGEAGEQRRMTRAHRDAVEHDLGTAERLPEPVGAAAARAADGHEHVGVGRGRDRRADRVGVVAVPEPLELVLDVASRTVMDVGDVFGAWFCGGWFCGGWFCGAWFFGAGFDHLPRVGVGTSR